VAFGLGVACIPAATITPIFDYRIVTTAAGCGSSRREATPARGPAENAATDEVDIAKLRAGAEADAYCRERAQVFATEAQDEIGRKDFTRFRHGALYAIGIMDSAGSSNSVCIRTRARAVIDTWDRC